MHQPIISVIIPVYNVEPYLRQCLDSVVNQTMHHIEIICVNDGSTDGSLAILEEYAAQDERITVISQENGGLNAARNAGLSHVSGEYFAIVDSDDWVDRQLCEDAYARALESNADMTMFFANCVGFPDKRQPSQYKISQQDKTNAIEKLETVCHLWQVCWCHLWKTSFVKRNHMIFHVGLSIGDEIPFVFRGAILANKISILPKCLYYYRYRSNSIMGDIHNPRFNKRATAYDLAIDDLKLDNLDQEVQLWIYKHKWNALTITYQSLPRNGRKELCRNIAEGVTQEEIQLLNNNLSTLRPFIRLLFLSMYGKIGERIWSQLKICKGGIADWFARKLIVHSPFLQHAFDMINQQRETIRLLQEKLRKKH